MSIKLYLHTYITNMHVNNLKNVFVNVHVNCLKNVSYIFFIHRGEKLMIKNDFSSKTYIVLVINITDDRSREQIKAALNRMFTFSLSNYCVSISVLLS